MSPSSPPNSQISWSFSIRMCKSKMSTDASQPTPGSRPHHRTTQSSSDQSLSSHASSDSSRTSQTQRASKPSYAEASTSNTSSAAYTSGSSYKLSSDNSISSRTSLSSLRASLPENPHIYDLKEICSATNNFLAKRYCSSSSTPSWRCFLRGKEVIVFQRKFRRKIGTSELKDRLSVICRSHHTSIIKLLGASVSGDHIYLVYEFQNGANLADCLRNPKNPDFTVLSTWMSRMQIATDLAHGLDYIHNKTGLSINLVHNHIKSSSVVVTEPSLNAKLCHFGSAQLCGEIDDRNTSLISKGDIAEVSDEKDDDDDDDDDSDLKNPAALKRSGSGRMQFEGVMGYMSPEFQSSGVATQESDVFAFGVVILELLSGNEPLKYKFDGSKREFVKTSLIESAKSAVDDGGGRLRQWMDRRLKDSFPVDVAEKLTRVAVECVHVDSVKRPNMERVAGKISKLYLESKTWSDNLTLPTDFSVSLAPR